MKKIRKPKDVNIRDTDGDIFRIEISKRTERLLIGVNDGLNAVFGSKKTIRRIAAKLNQIADWMDSK